MNNTKEVQVKLMKGLLDLIILQFLSASPMHGYQIITKIRKTFGVYFGPSTIYPLLNSLEKSGYVKSEWDMKNDRPRKVYRLTAEGQNLLNFTEYSLNLICKKIGTSGIQKETIVEENIAHATLNSAILKNMKSKTAYLAGSRPINTL
ncbi:MAG: PadR family transcriptional regulator [Candidatus Bathyarchaeia archaeon]